jgi:hypothetical protein
MDVFRGTIVAFSEFQAPARAKKRFLAGIPVKEKSGTGAASPGLKRVKGTGTAARSATFGLTGTKLGC